ncbi:crossover junction endodeoxyribonuclease RuvC [Roseospirillum parvum]|uniref:crossover junction endodeoxyribonuclease RuvC n=1 Tax=Roseospirillum parvum TaxID=83401 RepID=UPI000B89FC95|nr:crossover junction endodeoxyribonuclease RuvC [Roseospirillum parvum]
MRILGLDPGLRVTGWGLIEAEGNRLAHRGAGVLRIAEAAPMAARLADLFEQVSDLIDGQAPHEVAIEEVFVNRNPTSTLKLGQARGVVLLAPARAGLPVFEYAPNLIKKSVVGTGHAAKEQVAMMVSTLLPEARRDVPADATDALAVAICHAHHRGAAGRAAAGGGR